jgi:CDP-glycerol glycerophosphotransferase
MGKAKNLLMTGVLKHTKTKIPDLYTWVFSSVDNCHYNYNSRYLFEYVKENLKEITPLFVINDLCLREQLSAQYGSEYFIETETAKGIKRVLEAGVWFTSAGLPVYGTNLNKNRIIINLWHGVPLKKIALMDPNLGNAARLYFKKLFSDNYTYVLTTSHALIPVMAESFDVSEEKIKVWGQPRNDQIFTQLDRNKILSEIYKDLPEYEKTVLYAPTYRDYGQSRLFPFADFDSKKLEAFLEEQKMILFLRTHISEKASADSYISRRVRYLGNEEAEDVTGILNIFDLLITDYSSIYIDYLLTDKPIIFLPYDKEQYLKGRGMNFDYDDMAPGPKPETMEDFLMQIKTLIEEIGEDADWWKHRRTKVNEILNERKEPCAPAICRHILDEIKQQEKEREACR